MRTSENHNPFAISWRDIRDLTPMLFIHDQKVHPPQVARRLWAAITARGLNKYETEVKRSSVLSLLMTESLILQEFRERVWPSQSMLCPLSMVEYLNIPPQHVADILAENKIGPTSGESLDDVLTLDLLNRDEVAAAITDHFGHRDDVFRILAFPRGLTNSQHEMPLQDLLLDLDREQSGDEGLPGLYKPPDWDAGFAFIDNKFERTYAYTEITSQ